MEMDHERAAAMERAQQNRAIRGMILNILARSRTRPTMMKILESSVIAVGGNVSDTEEHVFYLESKGYAVRLGPDEHKIPGIGEVVRITAAGIDLVEGTTQDPGVVF